MYLKYLFINKTKIVQKTYVKNETDTIGYALNQLIMSVDKVSIIWITKKNASTFCEYIEKFGKDKEF